MAGVHGQRTFFDLWSRSYDLPLVQAAVYRPVQQAVLQALGDHQPSDLLDVGCGTGIFTARAAERLSDTRVVGSDFSGGMLRRASHRTAPAHWVQADALHLPFRDQTFGAVTCTEAFHWFPDQAEALREMHRVLTPGGLLALALIHPATHELANLLAGWMRFTGYRAHWPTRNEMREMATAAGFFIENQQHVRRLPSGLLLPAILTLARRP
jgi:ubiquinone/menaquinone biosynthesis C-methylase UbiE